MTSDHVQIHPCFPNLNLKHDITIFLQDIDNKLLRSYLEVSIPVNLPLAFEHYDRFIVDKKNLFKVIIYNFFKYFCLLKELDTKRKISWEELFKEYTYSVDIFVDLFKIFFFKLDVKYLHVYIEDLKFLYKNLYNTKNFVLKLNLYCFAQYENKLFDLHIKLIIENLFINKMFETMKKTPIMFELFAHLYSKNNNYKFIKCIEENDYSLYLQIKNFIK